VVLGVKLTNLLLGVSHVRKDGCPGAIRPRAYICPAATHHSRVCIWKNPIECVREGILQGQQ